MDAGDFDVVVLFPCAPGEDGLRLLSRARALQTQAQIVVIAPDESGTDPVRAVHMGAADCMAPPVSPEKLLMAVARACERSATHREMARLKRQLRARTRGTIVGDSRGLEQAFDLVERAAPTNVSVLITGETGTGKELFARAVHELSPRHTHGFVPVSCASVPDQLMESSLFGHVRGAFTGAVGSRPGLFEEARGGTIFLDEIECLRPDLQPKLLRVLQERMVQRVGGRHDVPVDFRAVAATNTDLWEVIEAGSFREDLYYRLNVFPVHLPPLRDRLDDIPLLATYFRDAFAEETYVEPLPIPDCCMEWMLSYSWPGNVRELKHTIERALLLSAGEERIRCSSMVHLTGKPNSPSWGRALAEDWPLSRLEQEYTDAVLLKTGGHKGDAARILGIDRRTLYRKLKNWHLH
jgi:DNA-binding NtrC family response regulator